MSATFERYEPVKGDIPHRSVGALVAHETGVSTSYGLFYAQERGTLFVGAGQNIYEGQIVGQNARPDDLVVNVCKQKHVTNMRNASASEDAMRSDLRSSHDLGGVPSVHRRRRAPRNHPQEPPYAQEGSQRRRPRPSMENEQQLRD